MHDKHDLKIVQLTNSLDLTDGGPARNCFELNIALNLHDGVSAALVSLTKPESRSVLSEHIEKGRSLPHIPPKFLASKNDAQKITPLQLLVRLVTADAVIIHGIFLSWVIPTLALSRLLRRRVVLMPHGALTPHELAKHRVRKKCFVAVVRLLVGSKSFSFATGSRVERDDIRAQFPWSDAHWVGVGTNAEHTPVSPRPPQNPVEIITLSRLTPKKRIDLAIQTVAELARRGLAVRLRVAGTGTAQMQESLRRLVTDEGLESRVEFVGLVSGEAKQSLMRGADVFILPSEDENFGIAVAEAAVSGLRIVASTAVAAAGMVERGAVLVDSLSPSLLADATERVLAEFGQADDRTQISTSAQSVFGWNRVALRWLLVIRGDAT